MNRVLIIYKKSAYQIYKAGRKTLARRHRLGSGYLSLGQLKKSHDAHFRTLDWLKAFLRKKHIRYTVMRRGHTFREMRYDLIITVGGDGTLLETARRIQNQVFLGVNSNPGQSVGKLCLLSRVGGEKKLESVLAGRRKVKTVMRIQPKLNGHLLKVRILNDALISHPNPAAMTHYEIRIRKRREEHRGSGIWISTAAGSTGAIKSAGGKTLPVESSKIQYRPRELYPYPHRKCHLRGGTLDPRSLKLRGLSDNLMIYVDGEKFHIPFSYGDRLEFVPSRYPLKLYL